MEIKIYTLADPLTNEIKYIGKTKNDLKARVRLHLNIKKEKNNKRVKWIKELKSKGLRPKAEILEFCSDSDWEMLEDFWINQFRTWGFDLVNTCDGGQGRRGYKMTDEERLVVSKQKPKAVIQYNLNGEVINEFPSIAEAAKQTGIKNANICSCCLGKSQTASSTIFKHKDNPLTEEELISRLKKSKGRKLWQ